MKKKDSILYNLTRLQNLRYLFLSFVFVFLFFHVDGLKDQEFAYAAIGAKRRAWRVFLFFIANNAYGYWIIKSGALIIGLIFGYIFISEATAKKDY